MVDRIPSGTRDYLPDEMRELRAMTDRLRSVFEQARYGEVYTPALEYGGTFERADQLDAGLEQLARVAPLRPDATVGVLEVAEAQRQLGGGVAGGDEAGDRNGGVRAQDEHVALLVEHPVRGPGGTHVGALERAPVLEHRRVDLSVSGPFEHLAHAVGHCPQLAHLVRQDVAGSAGDTVDHGALAARAARAAHACTGTSSTRSIRAPRSRSRPSICS
jgi:hypothetical protein